MKVIVFKNYPCEDAAETGRVFRNLGAELSVVNCYEGDPPPSPSSGNVLLILGGPMNVYDEENHPFLAWETCWIREWVESGRPTLGLCLGAQLIAKALGAQVMANPIKEIGHYSVSLTDEGAADPVFAGFGRDIPVAQWHGDTFDLPADAVHLARSQACEHQAFRIKRAIGLQFHLEIGQKKMAEWITEYRDEVASENVDAGSILAEFEHKEALYYDACNRFIRNFCKSECGLPTR